MALKDTVEMFSQRGLREVREEGMRVWVTWILFHENNGNVLDFKLCMKEKQCPNVSQISIPGSLQYDKRKEQYTLQTS